jgi:hypothetical protein
MPIDLDSGLAAFARGLELIPRIIVAPLLLGGPTLLWLLYRFLVRPGRVRHPPRPFDLTLWVCGSCDSLTAVGQSTCYRCHAERPAAVIELEANGKVRDIAPVPVMAPSVPDTGRGVPVGPGRPAPAYPEAVLPLPAFPEPVRPAPASPPPAAAFVLTAPPPTPQGPVISPPSRIVVSGRGTAGATSETT